VRTIGGIFRIGRRRRALVAARFSENAQDSLVKDTAFLSSQGPFGLPGSFSGSFLTGRARVDVDSSIDGMNVEAGWLLRRGNVSTA
jgi:hypothetical protein